jgi:hypothetical protein
VRCAFPVSRIFHVKRRLRVLYVLLIGPKPLQAIKWKPPSVEATVVGWTKPTKLDPQLYTRQSSVVIGWNFRHLIADDNSQL